MKILYVTTISLTMNSFFKPHIEMLVREGNHVDIACNFNDLAADKLYIELGCNAYQIDFSRSPLSPDNIRAYKQLKKVIEEGKYDIVHCHTPNAAAITRLVCKKFRKTTNLKVFYTAHGFHFYKGAPKLNWMIYYPVEKYCAKYTDKLLTINQEDFELAKAKFSAKEVCYVPGVGIDLSRFENIEIDKKEKRREIGVPTDAFLLLSVGELNENKNHQVIIRALAKLNNPEIHYAVAGVGDKKDYLLSLANELGVSKQVHLLGYRKDIPQLCAATDVFCFPSIREGLGLAAVEAMASGLPVIAADNRGTNEFVIPNKNGYLCKYNDIDGFANAISKFTENRSLKEQFSGEAVKAVKRYHLDNVIEVMRGIY